MSDSGFPDDILDATIFAPDADAESQRRFIDRHQGSNVDLPTYQEIDGELALIPHLRDAALRRFKTASDALPDAKHLLRGAMEQAWHTVGIKHSHAVADAKKAYAESAAREAKRRVERLEFDLEVAREVLRALSDRQTSVQSRSKMWLAQFESDRRGGSA